MSIYPTGWEIFSSSNSHSSLNNGLPVDYFMSFLGPCLAWFCFQLAVFLNERNVACGP